ncbi:MAG: fluoride efflux transporter CrcB [Gemmatimonadetes bacterium]|nr:fluoride efflux transporter CrcB [Gemmatimonadota bacterium]
MPILSPTLSAARTLNLATRKRPALYVTHILFVGLGGCIGAACRFLLSSAVQRLMPLAVVPWGTLVVNVVGCALIGVLAALAESRAILSDPLRLFVFTGVLGGFTTFSSFALETLRLTRGGDVLHGLVHIGLHLILCLAAVAAGDALTRYILR